MDIKKPVNIQNEALPPGDIAKLLAAQDACRTTVNYPQLPGRESGFAADRLCGK